MDDLFDTEEYAQTPAQSPIPPPRLTDFLSETSGRTAFVPSKRARISSKFYGHRQNIETLSGKPTEGALLNTEMIDSQTYQVPLEAEVPQLCLDYFSQKDLRDDLTSLRHQLDSHPPATQKQAKHDSDPYSKLRETKLFSYPKAVLFANISALFPTLISEKSFLIPVYNFVTICDKGGFAELIHKRYADINVNYNEIKGWALFPRTGLNVEDVDVLTDSELNFETLKTRLEKVRTDSDSMLGQSIMLLSTDFSVKQASPLQERLMKLYVSYSLYAGFFLLCKGGNLVFKVYETTHPATVELLYLAYRHFRSISILKPLASHAYSASKYVVCLDFLGAGEDLAPLEHLCKVLERLHKMGKDMEHILELTQVTTHEDFLGYVVRRNRESMVWRIARVKECLDNISQEEKIAPDKDDIEERCLVEWQLKTVEREEADVPRALPNRTATYNNPGEVSQLGREGNYADFDQILNRTAPQVPSFSPLARPVPKDKASMLDKVRSDDRKDAEQRMKKFVAPSGAKTAAYKRGQPGKRRHPDKEEGDPKKRHKA